MVGLNEVEVNLPFGHLPSQCRSPRSVFELPYRKTYLLFSVEGLTVVVVVVDVVVVDDVTDLRKISRSWCRRGYHLKSH